MTSKLHKSASEAVQTFREAQNLLPTLYTHLSALENIMTQKATLAGAARRREHCFATPSSSFLLTAEDYDDQLMATFNNTLSDADFLDAKATLFTFEETVQTSHRHTSHRGCVHATTPAAAAPLGVLAAFPVSTVHHLVAQHQRDEEELLAVVSRISQQSWPQKVEQLKAKAAVVEAQKGVSASEGSSHKNSASGNIFLLTPAQLSVAVYGLVACVMKMGSVLQEVTLALRKDMRGSLLSASSASVGATILADYLAALLTREGQLKSEDAALLSLHDLGNHERQNAGQVMAGQRALVSASDPLTLLEAVGRLEEFVKARWDYCRNVYLAEESLVLLENA